MWGKLKRDLMCDMALNVNGLTQSSVHDIEATIEDKKVDIVSVTETKFRLEENSDHHKYQVLSSLKPDAPMLRRTKVVAAY